MGNSNLAWRCKVKSHVNVGSQFSNRAWVLNIGQYPCNYVHISLFIAYTDLGVKN